MLVLYSIDMFASVCAFVLCFICQVASILMYVKYWVILFVFVMLVCGAWIVWIWKLLQKRKMQLGGCLNEMCLWICQFVHFLVNIQLRFESVPYFYGLIFHGLKGLVSWMVGFTVIVVVAKAGTISGVWHIFQVSFVCALMLDKEF
jgi:hypothetical protein